MANICYLGGTWLNTRKFVGLFTKTLLIGGVMSLLTSFFVSFTSYKEAAGWLDFSGLIVFFFGLGLVFSVISQAGFFAYLFIHRFGLSLFRTFWPTVQLVLIGVAVFDLIYLPYKGAEGKFPLYLLIIIALGLLIYGIIIAQIKAKQTHPRAFIPALFLMVVMTAIEWVPGLQAEGTDYAWLMITSLLACNTYQLLILHHLTRTDDEKVATSKKDQA